MYIGTNVILKEEKDIEGFTKVSFKPIKDKDGEKIDVEPIVFSDLILDELKTKEPMDLNYIRKVRCTPAVKEILAILLKYNIGLKDEIEVVLKKVADSLDNNYKHADRKVWGKTEFDRTMLDIHKIIIG